jgi:putative ABC transport system permease protein
MNIVVATPNAQAATAAARAIIADLRPDVAPRIRTIESIVGASVAGSRFVLVLAAALGGAALVLAVVGVYSVISYLVAQRTRELRIRLALGAHTLDIARLVVGHGARLAATGVLLGTIAAIATTRVLGSLLYGVTPTDPLSFIAVAAFIALMVLAACWLPARRAAQLDIVVGLRAD